MDYIKSVIIVDDEPLQCEILCQVLQKNTPKIKIYSATNGQEAYEYMRGHKVDVLVTDIQMPVMNGIELTRRTAMEWPEVKIILISAYQEFEYAHKALEYGAVDYLLKPFRMEKFLTIMEKIDGEIGKEQRNSVQMSYYEEITQLYHKDCQVKKMAELLRGKISARMIDEGLYQKLYGTGLVLLVRWKRQSGNRKEGLTQLQQEKLLQKIQKSFPKGYLVPLDKGVDAQEYRIVLVAPGSREEDTRQQMKGCLRELGQRQIIFWCGISREYENLVENISQAVEDAEEMVSFSFFTKNTGGIFSWSEYGENLDRIPKSIFNVERKIQEELHKGNIGMALENLNKLKIAYEEPPYITAFRLKHMISSMTMRLVRDLEGLLSQKEYEELVNKAYQLYGMCDSTEMLFEISSELFQNEAAYFAQETGHMDRVEDIISYMKKHYKETFSLQELADKVHFSAGYLSARIKTHTGMTYSEYLMSLRMEEAVRLLLNTNQKVTDIVNACGFNDSSYFNRAFRRAYNMSPEKYRKVHKNVEEIV